jgi:ubiquinone/menaquinone biosynthesis C-methylase UbiE
MSEELKKYECVAKDFSHDQLLESYHHLRRLEMVLYFLGNLGRKNLLILDAGCGDGVQAGRIAEAYKVVGVDLSPTRTKRAKKRVINGKFIVGDLYNLPFKSNTFDIVVLGEIIEHLHEPEKALLEINQSLKPNGYLIVDTVSRSNAIDVFLLFLMKINHLKTFLKTKNVKGMNLYDKLIDWGLYIDRTHVMFYDMKALKELLNQSNFNVIDIRGAPCLRYDFPSLIKPTILKIADKILSNIPYLKKYGAIQVFLCKKTGDTE